MLIKAKSTFKRRSNMNDVEIRIPVPPDALAPKFKCSTGKTKYEPEHNQILWTIKQFPGELYSSLSLSLSIYIYIYTHLCNNPDNPDNPQVIRNIL